jgi:hypothetical protein
VVRDLGGAARRCIEHGDHSTDSCGASATLVEEAGRGGLGRSAAVRLAKIKAGTFGGGEAGSGRGMGTVSSSKWRELGHEGAVSSLIAWLLQLHARAPPSLRKGARQILVPLRHLRITCE